jgi:hypothetical protein
MNDDRLHCTVRAVPRGRFSARFGADATLRDFACAAAGQAAA